MLAARIELMQQMPIFGAIDAATIEFLLEPAPVIEVAAGDYFCREGDLADGMYVLERGCVTVSKSWQDQRLLLRRLGPGDCFGEVALIDGGKRSADIVAESHLHCYGISRDVFRPYVQDHPDVAWALLEELAAKLRKAEPGGDGGGGVTARLGLRRRR